MPETSTVRSRDDLSDLVAYANRDGATAGLSVEWLTMIETDQTRVNLHCLKASTRILKRCVDVVGAAVGLVVLAPVFLIVGLLVRLTSRGPVIYRQVRVGLNLRTGLADRRLQAAGAGPEPWEAVDVDFPAEVAGGDEPRGADRRKNVSFGRPFVIYKFRTMVVDAERGGAQLARANDSRITPLGRFLRRARLDEIPQLVNILRGDMSLVGPRPERPEFIQKLSGDVPGYLNRLGLRPGLTGVAQILNGYDEDLSSVRRKVWFDLLYLQNCSLWNDAKILLRTVRVVLTGSGAR